MGMSQIMSELWSTTHNVDRTVVQPCTIRFGFADDYGFQLCRGLDLEPFLYEGAKILVLDERYPERAESGRLGEAAGCLEDLMNNSCMNWMTKYSPCKP